MSKNTMSDKQLLATLDALRTQLSIVMERPNDYTKVLLSGDMVADEVEDIRGDSVEHVVVLELDGAGHLIERFEASKGTVNSSLVHPREIFRRAIQNNSSSIVVVHNHPGGSTTPSDADLATTKRLLDAGELLGIHVADHIIVTAKSWASILDSNEWLEYKDIHC